MFDVLCHGFTLNRKLVGPLRIVFTSLMPTTCRKSKISKLDSEICICKCLTRIFGNSFVFVRAETFLRNTKIFHKLTKSQKFSKLLEIVPAITKSDFVKPEDYLNVSAFENQIEIIKSEVSDYWSLPIPMNRYAVATFDFCMWLCITCNPFKGVAPLCDP